jgi:PAS domain S-box-containing protein
MPTTPHVDLDYKLLFENLPDRYTVFHAQGPDYTILTASKAYLEMTDRTLTSLEGEKLFDAFPDTSPRAKKTGKGELRESLDRCVETKQPDHMGVIRYDIADANGELAVKYWGVIHTPVLDDDGNVRAIVQSTEDVTDDVVASDRLALTKLQLDDALSAGSIGSWIWDVTNNRIVANKGLGKMFELNSNEISAGLPLETFTGVIHPKDRKRVEKLIQETLKSGKKYEAEYRIVGKKGHERWVIARGRVERNAHGKVTRFPGVMIDITERKLAEDKALNSENSLRFMANAMPQLVWVTRPDGYHEYYNKQWYEYTGTEPGSTDGEGWNNLFHPNDRERARQVWKHSLKSGEPYEIEYRLYHAATKSYRWVIGRALPYKNDSGEILKWYGTCTDIDDQKRTSHIQAFLANASKELSSSLDFTTTLNNITRLCIPEVADWCTVDIYNEKSGWDQIALAHTDPSKISLARRYREMNPIDVNDPNTGLMRLLDDGEAQFYPFISEELIATSIEDPERRNFMISLDLHSIIMAPLVIKGKTVGAITLVSSESGRYYTETDLEMVKELASRISLHMTNAELYEDTQRELQERRKLEEYLRLEKEKLEARVKQRTKQLQEYSDSLARSNQELQDFAYVASHDLQEPLRKIQAFGTLLADEYDDSLGEGKDYLIRMRSAAERMSTLIQDLLSFSRVTTMAKPDVTVPLNVVVRDVLSDLETRIQETNGSVEVGDMPIVNADPTQMRQLFQNLIGNALKFHREDAAPHIVVSAKPFDAENKFYEFSIADNGIGFDEKYLDRIFSVFQRLHNRGTYEGTGIGLAVCKKIVERYGGTIGAASKKDQGSTFTFTLPAATKETVHDIN